MTNNKSKGKGDSNSNGNSNSNSNSNGKVNSKGKGNRGSFDCVSRKSAASFAQDDTTSFGVARPKGKGR